MSSAPSRAWQPSRDSGRTSNAMSRRSFSASSSSVSESPPSTTHTWQVEQAQLPPQALPTRGSGSTLSAACRMEVPGSASTTTSLPFPSALMNRIFGIVIRLGSATLVQLARHFVDVAAAHGGAHRAVHARLGERVRGPVELLDSAVNRAVVVAGGSGLERRHRLLHLRAHRVLEELRVALDGGAGGRQDALGLDPLAGQRPVPEIGLGVL